MARMLADAKQTLWLLDEMPEDPKNPTAAEINAGQDISCVIGKAGFNLGSGTSNKEADTPLCTEGETQVPTSKTYEVAMNIYRYFDADTGQIDPAEDFFFQAVKEFGSEVVVALRDGGKAHTEDADAGDEVSLYRLISGGMGRSTDGGGYSKRVADFSVVEGHEDVVVVAG
ncbi:MAG TPA: hypothetical protein VK054_11545 [Beutenbergiaceae bacterium]|nr:hypothetical protein [Beutenbergiaceae bacterium]